MYYPGQAAASKMGSFKGKNFLKEEHFSPVELTQYENGSKKKIVESFPLNVYLFTINQSAHTVSLSVLLLKKL